MALAIEASRLVKSFGETRAVNGVDLAVRPGADPVGQIGWEVLACVALIAVFGPLTMHLYRNKQSTGVS